METWFSDLSSTHAQLVNQNDYTEKSHSQVQDSGRGAAGLIDASLAGRGSCSRGRPLALGYRVASPLLSGTGSRAAGDWSPVRCHWDPCGVEGTAENNRWGCNQGYNIMHIQKSGLCITYYSYGNTLKRTFFCYCDNKAFLNSLSWKNARQKDSEEKQYKETTH